MQLNNRFRWNQEDKFLLCWPESTEETRSSGRGSDSLSDSCLRALLFSYTQYFQITDSLRRLVIIVFTYFYADVVVSFNTTYVDANGQLVHDRRQLAIHYLRGWFLIDALAAMPVDFTLAVVQTIWTSDLGKMTPESGHGMVWSEQNAGLNETLPLASSNISQSTPIWNVVSFTISHEIWCTWVCFFTVPF